MSTTLELNNAISPNCLLLRSVLDYLTLFYVQIDDMTHTNRYLKQLHLSLSWVMSVLFLLSAIVMLFQSLWISVLLLVNSWLLFPPIIRKLSFIKKGDLILFPTVPTIAPLKKSLEDMEIALDFYDRTMSITSFSGVGRLPEISIPIANIDNAPVGLSVAAGFYQDEFLISSVKQLLLNSTKFTQAV